MEGEVEGHHKPQESPQGREDALHAPEAQSCDEQPNFYLPYLFTYQREDCKGMPNTNNKIEGTFTDLKKKLNNHSGLTKENRKRFISGFFLALTETLNMKKQESR